MTETPTLYVCHGDDGGPRIHPCRRVQEALHDAGAPYDSRAIPGWVAEQRAQAGRRPQVA